jgi:hypothetical protein
MLPQCGYGVFALYSVGQPLVDGGLRRWNKGSFLVKEACLRKLNPVLHPSPDLPPLGQIRFGFT